MSDIKIEHLSREEVQKAVYEVFGKPFNGPFKNFDENDCEWLKNDNIVFEDQELTSRNLRKISLLLDMYNAQMSDDFINGKELLSCLKDAKECCEQLYLYRLNLEGKCKKLFGNEEPYSIPQIKESILKFMAEREEILVSLNCCSYGHILRLEKLIEWFQDK